MQIMGLNSCMLIQLMTNEYGTSYSTLWGLSSMLGTWAKFFLWKLVCLEVLSYT